MGKCILQLEMNHHKPRWQRSAVKTSFKACKSSHAEFLGACYGTNHRPARSQKRFFPTMTVGKDQPCMDGGLPQGRWREFLGNIHPLRDPIHRARNNTTWFLHLSPWSSESLGHGAWQRSAASRTWGLEGALRDWGPSALRVPQGVSNWRHILTRLWERCECPF